MSKIDEKMWNDLKDKVKFNLYKDGSKPNIICIKPSQNMKLYIYNNELIWRK